MKERMRAILAAALVPVLSLAVFAVCSVLYPVSNEGIPDEETCAFLQRSEVCQVQDLDFFGGVYVGDQRVDYFDWGDDLGQVHLTRCLLTGTYRIDSVSWGGGNFREEILEEDGQKYFLLAGRNAYFGIARAEADIANCTYDLEIRAGDRFVTVTEIERAESDHVLPEDVRFYDKADRDISDEVPW